MGAFHLAPELEHQAAGGVLVVDFGAQYSQLIARRVRECRVFSAIVPHDIDPAEVARIAPGGIILSGGPASVYEDGAPTLDRRLLAGAARDHFLGFEGVSGRGIVFKAGGKVVKNVTGFDLPKLMAGSWGTLALLTAVTLKVVPKPKATTTLLVHGLSPAKAVQAMTRAVSLPLSVSGAAHEPNLTALRLEGFGPSVAARLERLKGEMSAFGDLEVKDEAFSKSFWRDVGSLAFAGQDGDLDRISTSAAEAAETNIEGLAEASGSGFLWRIDWGGSLIWFRHLPGRTIIQHDFSVGLPSNFHQSCVRGRLPILYGNPSPLDALNARVSAAFDPAGVFLKRPPLYRIGA